MKTVTLACRVCSLTEPCAVILEPPENCMMC